VRLPYRAQINYISSDAIEENEQLGQPPQDRLLQRGYRRGICLQGQERDITISTDAQQHFGKWLSPDNIRRMNAPTCARRKLRSSATRPRPASIRFF
jgi:hypothetical protein